MEGRDLSCHYDARHSIHRLHRSSCTGDSKEVGSETEFEYKFGAAYFNKVV